MLVSLLRQCLAQMKISKASKMNRNASHSPCHSYRIRLEYCSVGIVAGLLFTQYWKGEEKEMENSVPWILGRMLEKGNEMDLLTDKLKNKLLWRQGQKVKEKGVFKMNTFRWKGGQVNRERGGHFWDGCKATIRAFVWVFSNKSEAEDRWKKL